MYANAKTLVDVGEGYSKEFEVKVSFHAPSVTLEWALIASSAMVHKKCSELKPLTEDPYYRRTLGQGTGHPLDGRPQREVCRT